MEDLKWISISSQDLDYLEITLNRPQVHNAFNSEMIAEITQVFKAIKEQALVKFVILKAEGKSFSAGADLEWMKKMKEASLEDNRADALKLALMFETINECPIPVIALVEGNAFGGGVGLLAVCDYVLCLSSVQFCFSEVKLGLAPAVISPFVYKKIQHSFARAFFITGKNFSAMDALKMGLVHEVVEGLEWEEKIRDLKSLLKSLAPNAQRATKKLIFDLESMLLSNDNEESKNNNIKNYTTSLIADLRKSDEGQVGMTALLEKRKPQF